MSVYYNVERPVYVGAPSHWAKFGMELDLSLLGNAQGVTDDGRWYSIVDWRLNSENYVYCSPFRLALPDTTLTIGGDYSASPSLFDNYYTGEAVDCTYNIYNAVYGAPTEASAVNADHNLRLVLTAQAGSYYADQNQDANIKIRSESTVSVRGQVNSAYPTVYHASALAVKAGGTLTVSSDLLGTLEAVSDITLGAFIVKEQQAISIANTDGDADAIGARAADIVLNRNFNATITVDARAYIFGAASPVVTDNTASAIGLRALGDLTATAGEWNGNITATTDRVRLRAVGKTDSCDPEIMALYNTDEYLQEIATNDTRWGSLNDVLEYIDFYYWGNREEFLIDYLPDCTFGMMSTAIAGTASTRQKASLTGNDVSAYGLWADGTITIAHCAGDDGQTEILSTASGNVFNVDVMPGTASSVTATGNTISAVGIKGGTVNLAQVDDTFRIETTVSGNTVTLGSAVGLTMSGNTVGAFGISASTLKLGSFNGTITANFTANSFSGQAQNSKYSGKTTITARGISVASLTATDNLDGVIIIIGSDNTGYIANSGAGTTLEYHGIRASGTITVTGRINTAIDIASLDNDTRYLHRTTYGIFANRVVADAFSGSISIDSPAITSVGINAEQKLATSVSTEAFDINGSIGTLGNFLVGNGIDYGVLSLGLLNLRVSGEIYARNYAIQSEIYLTGGTLYFNNATVNADKIEFADTAVVVGNVELNTGENTVIVNTNALIVGNLLATGGLMNIRFDLDGAAQDDPVISTDAYDVSVTSKSTISVNLNNAVDGEDYMLFRYAGDVSEYWTSGQKTVTFAYMGQSERVAVDVDGNATATFHDAGGRAISAALHFSYDTMEEASRVTVHVDRDNFCVLQAFGGTLSTELDNEKRTAELQWGKAVSAENYEVEYQIAEDGVHFGKSIVVMAAGNATSTTVQAVDVGAAIRWRVRGNTGDGSEVSLWSEWSDDTQDALGVRPLKMSDSTPRAINPDEEGSGVTTARARFTWEAATGNVEIAGYELHYIESKVQLTDSEIAARYASGNHFTKSTTATEILASSLTNQSYIYWRVRAVDVDGAKSDWSTGNSFRIWAGDYAKPVWRALSSNETDAATAAVTYDRSNAYNVTIDVNFSWISATDSQSGVKSYVLQYKLASASWIDETAVSSITLAETGKKTYSASVKGLAGGLYDYRIKAVDFVGNESVYLVTDSFGSADLTPPVGAFTNFATPTVVGDWDTQTITYYTTVINENGEEEQVEHTKTVTTLTGATVTLAWSDNFTDDNGVIYTVELSDNVNFLGSKHYFFTTTEKTLVLDDSVGTSVSSLAGLSTVYYRVSVADSRGNVNPLSSAVQSFNMVDTVTGEKIVIPSKIAAPTYLGYSTTKVAVGDAFRTNVTFHWTGGSNAFGVSTYTLKVTVGKKTTTYTGITANSYTLQQQIDGKYTWQVIANSGAASSSAVSGPGFTVDATAPVFASTATSAAISRNDFVITWKAASDANGIRHYLLQYGPGAYDAGTWMSTTVTGTSYKGNISSDGLYNYRVYAVDSFGNTSTVCAEGSFEIAATKDFGGSAGSATQLTLSERNTRTIGLTNTADWVKFTVADAGSDVVISLSDIASKYNGGTGITVKLFAPGDLKKAIATTKIVSGTQLFQYNFKKTGDYYMQILPVKKTALMSYTLQVDAGLPEAATVSAADSKFNGLDTDAGKLISAYDYDGVYRLALPAANGTLLESGLLDGTVSGVLLSDYVGKTDATDYRRFDVAVSGNYNFTVTGAASPLKFTVYSVSLDGIGNVTALKAVKTVSLTPKYNTKTKKWVDSVSTGALLLKTGTYYFSVNAPQAAKNKNSKYTVSVKGEAFINADQQSDDTWPVVAAADPGSPTDIEVDCWTIGDHELDPSVTIGAVKNPAAIIGEWVGYGDTTDYRRINVSTNGLYTFALGKVANETSLTLYSVSGNKLTKIKAVTVKAGKSGKIASQLLNAGTYAVAVTATQAKNGKGTEYALTVGGTGFVKANQQDDNTWRKAAEGNTDTTIAEIDYDPLTGAVTNPAVVTGEWVGYGDTVDYREIDFAVSGLYTFALGKVANETSLTLCSISGGKLTKIKSITVKAGKSGKIASQLLNAGTYYVAVTATQAKSGKCTDYDLSVTGTGFVRANQQDDNTLAKAAANPGAQVAVDCFTLEDYALDPTVTVGAIKDPAIVTGEWVGYGDPIDYREVAVSFNGLYTFSLGTVANETQMTLWSGTGTKIKDITVKAGKSGKIASQLLKAGIYYVSVKATQAKSGKGTDYDLTVSGTGFVKANQVDDNTWLIAKDNPAAQFTVDCFTPEDCALDPNVTLGAIKDSAAIAGEWVGYGDPIDYRRITLTYGGRYNFTVSGVSNDVKLSLYSFSAATDQTTLIKSLTVTVAKSPLGTISSQLLAAGTYYVAVEAPLAKSGKGTDYDLTVSGTGFVKANLVDDNTMDKAAAAPAAQVTLACDGVTGEVLNPEIVTDEWVGFGDTVDYRQIVVDYNGLYNVVMTGVTSNAKLTLYDEAGKAIDSVAVTTTKPTSGALKSKLLAAGTYYVAVEATAGNSGKNTDYSVSFTGTGFIKADNGDDNWQALNPGFYAPVAVGDSFENWVGFGDTIDYREIQVAGAGETVNFLLSGMTQGAKLTVYTLDTATNRLTAIKSVTSDANGSAVSTGDLALDGTKSYYLAVEATGAAKGLNTDYVVNAVRFDRDNNSFESATVLAEGAVEGFLTTTLGGDKLDFIDLYGMAGNVLCDLGEGRLKLSFFDENKQAVATSAFTFADATAPESAVSSLTLTAGDAVTDRITLAVDGTIRYLKIEAANTGVNTYSLLSA